MKRTPLITAIIAVVAFAVVPEFVDVERSYFVYYLFLTFIYVVLSQGWNVVAGYAGQVSMGQHAFFGLGAYTTGIIWLNDLTHTGYYFDPVVMLLSGVVPVLVAVVVGIPLLSRLRGDYFTLGTLGVGEIVRVFFVKGGEFTGAQDGLHLPSRVYASMSPYYYTSLILAVAATLGVYLLTRSNIGLALRAINEDDTSAASHGVNILRFKILAFAIGAFFAGVGGSLYGIYLFHINPDSVLNLNWSLYPILMCVIGGNGTIFGPVIGAFFMTAVFLVTEMYFPEIHPILAGGLIVLVMRFMPSGLIGLADRLGGSEGLLKNIRLFQPDARWKRS
ncbi:MAG: branched-chain amino acid ABC transporter permease [Desulfopila sp.]